MNNNLENNITISTEQEDETQVQKQPEVIFEIQDIDVNSLNQTVEVESVTENVNPEVEFLKNELNYQESFLEENLKELQEENTILSVEEEEHPRSNEDPHKNNIFPSNSFDPGDNVVGNETPSAFLERTVFPTLLPGIEQLLRFVKRKESSVNEEGLIGIEWLADYLKKNNPNSLQPNQQQQQMQTPTLQQQKQQLNSVLKLNYSNKQECFMNEPGVLQNSSTNNTRVSTSTISNGNFEKNVKAFNEISIPATLNNTE
ncbi:hypothetical protein HDU92_004624 [Lobulomyces angularis]|nr:hypothetical protein HDU92_004624 [Lobulomyces angularis]